MKYLSIPKLQRCNRWSLGMDQWFHTTLYNGYNYLSMLGLTLNHVSKSGPRWLYSISHLKLVLWYLIFSNSYDMTDSQIPHNCSCAWVVMAFGEFTAQMTSNAENVSIWWLSWWRHQMETFSALLVICAGNSPVPGEFPAQRAVTRGFDVFFDLRLNKRFSKQSWCWWFETLSRPLWRHCNVPEIKQGTNPSNITQLWLYFYIYMSSKMVRYPWHQVINICIW